MRSLVNYLLKISIGVICTGVVDRTVMAQQSPGPMTDISVSRPIWVDPVSIDNCEVWVELAYAQIADISKNEVKIINSKPPGKYDAEAINSLVQFHSGISNPANSRHFSRHNADGTSNHSFTFFRSCNDGNLSGVEPNHSLNAEASKAGSG